MQGKIVPSAEGARLCVAKQKGAGRMSNNQQPSWQELERILPLKVAQDLTSLSRDTLLRRYRRRQSHRPDRLHAQHADQKTRGRAGRQDLTVQGDWMKALRHLMAFAVEQGECKSTIGIERDNPGRPRAMDTSHGATRKSSNTASSMPTAPSKDQHSNWHPTMPRAGTMSTCTGTASQPSQWLPVVATE